MVYNIINKVRKQIYKNSDILILVGIVIFLIIICFYFKRCNNSDNKNKILNNLDSTNVPNINEGFENNFEKLFKKNESENSSLEILQQIKKSIGQIDNLLFNLDSEIMGDVEKGVKPSINKNVNLNKFEFVNISGIESFSGLPFMNQNLNSKQLTLNIKDDMPIDMQLKRMKIVLQELKRKVENGEIDSMNNTNGNRKIENFNDMKANEILKEIGNLLHDISNKTNIKKHITQEEDNTYTVEEEILIRENNKNQEDRKKDKDLAENVYIESVESEGLNDIYHPRIQII